MEDIDDYTTIRVYREDRDRIAGEGRKGDDMADLVRDLLITRDGLTLANRIQTWDRKDITVLKDALEALNELTDRVEEYGIDLTFLPSAHIAEIEPYSEYPIWACDEQRRCLVSDHNGAYQILTLDEIINS